MLRMIENILAKKAFLLMSLLLILSSQVKSQSDIKFKRFAPDQGLSMNDIRAITQDKKGFIWIGTLDGLNRFDGYNFTVYKNNPKIKNSLSNNTIWALFLDKRGDLYIGTDDGGLNVYNEALNNFTSYKHDPKDPTSISGNEISAIFEDSKGTLWIGIDGGGLNSFDRDTKKFTSYKHNPQNPNSILGNVVKTITEDKQGNLWIGTDNGISVWDKNRKTFTHYQHDDKDPISLGFNGVIKIYVDSENKKWIGTFFGLYAFNDSDHSFTTYLAGGNSIIGNYVPDIYENKEGQLWIATNFGISVLDKKTNNFTTIQTRSNDPLSLIDNGMNTFFWDRRGNIWVGTFVGLCMKEAGDAKFQHFTNDPTNSNTLGNKEAACFYEDRKNNIWIGIRSGLDKFDKTNRSFAHYQPIQNGNFLLRDILSFHEDKYNNFWIGTGNGLCLYDKDKGTFDRLAESNPGSADNVQLQEIWYIREDSKDSMWVCSFNKGVFRFDRKEKRFYPLKWGNKYIPNKDIFSFHIDKEDNIWIGTALEGLYKINEEKGIYEVFKKGDKNSINSNFILTIYEDKRDNFWVGTRGGLNLMDQKTNKFISYTESDGLPNNVINSILEDNKGNLWMGTYKGISKFDPFKKTFKNYTIDDGLQHSNFWQRSACKLRSGELLLGGMNGFNLFDPNSLRDNMDQPKVYLTDFQIFNKSVPIGEDDSPLKTHISETEKIVLSYKQSVISFEFVALNYIISKNNKYAYKLEGFDKDWNYVGAQRKATYTNLDAGKYVFKVKGSNNDGIWNDTGSSITLIITPPFWETWWFKILCFMIVVGSAISWYRIRINAIKRQKEVLELQVKERTAEILMQKEEIEAQADHLKEANIEIKAQGQKLEEIFSEVKDSIRAAQVLQESILPSSSFLEQHLPESFVLYKPKDVVSGDFYWFDVIKEKIILAAVDCTGHGVSGAFMSINGHHLLNQAIYPYENLVASEILDRLNEGVIKALHHHNRNEDVKDGMDVALCIVDKEKMKLQYAGANNPLYILRGNEIIQIKANKFSIGLVVPGQVFKFSNNEIDLQKGDTIYLFSDGYVDQIGGESGNQKFMYNQFRQLLIENGSEDMKHQLKELDENLTAWQKDVEQLDDILVIGFKI